MSVQVIGHAATVIGGDNFASYAMAMGNRFRGFATLETDTIIATSKIKGGKGSGYTGRITKHSKIQVVLNPRLEGYADAVNAQRAREHSGPIENLEHFEPAPRAWGHHVPGTSFVEHKGNYYLEVRVLRSLETSYCIDGQPVTKETAESLLHPPRGGGRQHVQKPVILRDYRVESIVGITWTCPETSIKYELTVE